MSLYAIGNLKDEKFITVITVVDMNNTGCIKRTDQVIYNKSTDFTIFGNRKTAGSCLKEIKENRNSIQFTDNCFINEILDEENEINIDEWEVCELIPTKLKNNRVEEM